MPEALASGAPPLVPGPPLPAGVPVAAPLRASTDVVAAVTARVARLYDAPPAEHVAAYDEVHRLLQDALARIDEG